MKKLITILLLTALTSCGAFLEPPKSNTDYKNIIGKPIEFGNLEIAQYDFPEQMNWEDAKKACAELGEGWELPSLEKLNILYQNKDAIRGRGFAIGYYWSSTEYYNNTALIMNFGGGPGYENKNKAAYVRAVRSLKPL